jgi:hypothetical protein
MSMSDLEARMDCQECGQNVSIQDSHTFVDCALYVVGHHETVSEKYSRALKVEVERLRADRALARLTIVRLNGRCNTLTSDVKRLRSVVNAALSARRAPDAVDFQADWRRHYIEGLTGYIEHHLQVECGVCKVLDLAAAVEAGDE